MSVEIECLCIFSFTHSRVLIVTEIERNEYDGTPTSTGLDLRTVGRD